MEPELARKYQRQAEMLANRVKKRYKHLAKRFGNQKIEVFRLYDWDIPEIRAVVDWYAGHLVVGEYTRKQSTADWLPMMGTAVTRALNVSTENLHLKERRAGYLDGRRYQRLDYTEQKIIVTERDLRFYVNPKDFVDTGLFSDHRDTRQMVRKMAQGKDFLNLFCYTATFSCYAAKGGARSTVSVDRSETAIKWARQNLKLNKIDFAQNKLFQSHVFDFLKKMQRKKQFFDLAIVDPPSFSKTFTRQIEFDIQKDHPQLLNEVVAVMRRGGVIFFSTNHQRFTPILEDLSVSGITEITNRTIPEDYRHKRKSIHRCWKIVV
ncbi:MAG: class I SAM-dependent methyltransferase [Desulfobacteraceae bacterium]|jgi:23S rRNA (cytosine1962-C5)-methyltransferase